MAELTARSAWRWLDPRSWPRRRRVRTPTVLQMQSAECGAACLGIILGYFGRWEPLEKLRHACGVSRDGAKATNVLRAARGFGLIAKAFSIPAAEVRRAPLPVVAFWGFTHFVVVEGFGRNRVWLNDPATGPRVVSSAYFDATYSGVLLAFQRGRQFVPNEPPPGAVASLLERTRSVRRALAFAVLASLALFVPGLLMPALSRVYVDYYLIEDQQRWLLPILALMTATALVAGTLSWLLERCLTAVYTKLQTVWAGQMVWRVLRLPVDYFAHRSGGDVSTRIQSNGWLAWLVASELSSTFLGLTTLVLYALIMLQYDVVLTVVGVGFAAINLVVFFGVSRQLRDRNQQLHRDKGKASGILMQGLRSIDTYQASGTEAIFYNQWAGYQAKVANAGQAIGRRRAVLSALPPFLGLLSTTAILLVGGLRIMDGTLTIGMLVAFQGLMAAFSLPVKRVIDAGAELQEAQGMLNRLDDVMRQEEDGEFRRPAGPLIPTSAEPGGDVLSPLGPPKGTIPGSVAIVGSDPAPAATLPKLPGTLELRAIRFGYSPLSRPLIDGFDLCLSVGARVALVGPSGSGKTTIGRIIAGLLVPWEGEVLIAGRPLAEIPRDVFRNTVAVVDQSIALFDGTVAQNVTMWDPTLPQERMVEAARDACLHQDVAARLNGYREPIEEGGRNFSGGERQRIEIARALVGDPGILVLDEATSALDAETESRIIANLRRRGCTCVVIAHRLSTIRDCDEIVVLDHGRVVERGTHEELMAAGGRYLALLES